MLIQFVCWFVCLFVLGCFVGNFAVDRKMESNLAIQYFWANLVEFRGEKGHFLLLPLDQSDTIQLN